MWSEIHIFNSHARGYLSEEVRVRQEFLIQSVEGGLVGAASVWWRQLRRAIWLEEQSRVMSLFIVQHLVKIDSFDLSQTLRRRSSDLTTPMNVQAKPCGMSSHVVTGN